jgi:hypothetical protein
MRGTYHVLDGKQLLVSVHADDQLLRLDVPDRKEQEFFKHGVPADDRGGLDDLVAKGQDELRAKVFEEERFNGSSEPGSNLIGRPHNGTAAPWSFWAN